MTSAFGLKNLVWSVESGVNPKTYKLRIYTALQVFNILNNTGF